MLYVAEAEDVIVERVLDRGHPRIPTLTRPLVTAFVRTAVATFEHLASEERIRACSLVARNGHLVASPKCSDRCLDVFTNLLQKAIADSRDSCVNNAGTTLGNYTEVLS